MSKLYVDIEQLEAVLMQLIERSKEQKNALQQLTQENAILKKELEQTGKRKKTSLDTATMHQWLTEYLATPNQEILNHYISTVNDCISLLEKIGSWKN